MHIPSVLQISFRALNYWLGDEKIHQTHKNPLPLIPKVISGTTGKKTKGNWLIQCHFGNAVKKDVDK